MRVCKYTLDIDKFERDFSFLIRLRDDEETVLKDVLARVNAAKSNITAFLRDVDSIEDEMIRESCRSAAIAQMYQVSPDRISSQSNWVLVIQPRRYVDGKPVYSSAIVSKYGDLISDEGTINVSSASNYGRGWIVRSVIDGKYGFISNYGDSLLPCIFDEVDLSDEGISSFNLKKTTFELAVYDKQSELEKEWFEQLLSHSRNAMSDFIICRSNEGVLFELKAEESDLATYQEALKEVKASLSLLIVSQEELKQLAGDPPEEDETIDDECLIFEGTEIEDERFQNCKFSEVEFPDTLESIGECAFFNCQNLKSIRIPKSVKHIGDRAFSMCGNLESIEVEEDNPNYCSDGNCVLTKDGKTLVLGCKTSKIPDSVEHIGNNAFWGCNLTSIKIPCSVSTIGCDAFDVCPNLTTIEIPDSIKDYSAFHEIKSLKDIFLPSGGPLKYGGFRDGFQSKLASQLRWFAGVDRYFRKQITLHVPEGTEEEYREDKFFGTFGRIVSFDDECFNDL